jgi:hypothetical protein
MGDYQSEAASVRTIQAIRLSPSDGKLEASGTDDLQESVILRLY